MKTQSRAHALIFAGGVGRRMHTNGVPKQFLKIFGKPVMAKCLLHASELRELSLIVLAQARDAARLHETLESQGVSRHSQWATVIGDIRTELPISGPVDYIIHAAAPTSSAYFVEKPVETIEAVYQGTAKVLALAREKDIIKKYNIIFVTI